MNESLDLMQRTGSFLPISPSVPTQRHTNETKTTEQYSKQDDIRRKTGEFIYKQVELSTHRSNNFSPSGLNRGLNRGLVVASIKSLRDNCSQGETIDIAEKEPPRKP